MKKITSKHKIEEAKRLAEIIEKRKELEREEKKLKAFFKSDLQGQPADIGGVLISFKTQQRTYTDTDLMAKQLGQEVVDKYRYKKEVTVMEIQDQTKVAL